MTLHKNNITGTAGGEITLDEVKMGNELFYKIAHADKMRPFFMTIVSDADHWLFVSSNGGISAGRKSAGFALFPYYTEDKITEGAEMTGSKTILRVTVNGKQFTWEPFAARSEALFSLQRNIYKSRYGNKIVFEEINHDLSLAFSYEWNTSDLYGFVRKARLVNHSAAALSVELLDGLQNILPYGVDTELQNTTSNLADAYKRNELLPDCGLGIFTLSAIIVDKAEPSEALKANIVWSAGLENPVYLLSSAQLPLFRQGGTIRQEEDVKGEKGAYFISGKLDLAPGEDWNWLIVADVNKNHSSIVRLADSIRQQRHLVKDVLADIDRGTSNLLQLVSAADGIQYSADEPANARHFANTLFNIMRGGIFDDNYFISKSDFTSYVLRTNKSVYARHEKYLQALPERVTAFEVKQFAEQVADPDIIRLATVYLPLRFSRRHGDPSRPWNKFTINTRRETDGAKVLDYEGNWRDIFQNWEALAHSYPAFIEGMIFKFLNASTFDGYNPYRVTKDGYDWETIEPDNPWSYIGYWGDHQVIYLLKFLEFVNDRYPHWLTYLLDKNYFVYADVPYRIGNYKQIAANPKDTITYDHAADKAIQKRVAALGADGLLLTDSLEQIHKVNLAEKLLAMLLAKLSNFVPGGGIWMNTQRPEWNDANNALVGNGLSMVTLYYLRRFLVFAEPVFTAQDAASIPLSVELHTYFTGIAAIFEKYAAFLPGGLSNRQKKAMLDEAGEASSLYRETIYTARFSGAKATVKGGDISKFIKTAIAFSEHAVRVSARADGLYHTYNLLSFHDEELTISHLDEMLEGQVAVLSSGCLSATESLQLLEALQRSSLYRPDQDSYILYPNKPLPSFLRKNTIEAEAVQSIPLLKQLLSDGHTGIIEKDILGSYHFNGNFKNANDLEAALQNLDSRYQTLVNKDRSALLELFEKVFNHKAFTGRSGTFFAYEGLGSIYWHMVSKLLLSVQETYLRSAKQLEDESTLHRLAGYFHAIKKGIGVHKPPSQYGAFPTDPYSHTPFGKGAQQPGMTGQVKEDIISRFGELGVTVRDGLICFEPQLLRKDEFLKTEREISFINIHGEEQRMLLPEGSILFTLCQVPVLYILNQTPGLQVKYSDGIIKNAATLSREESKAVFNRTGAIESITVFIHSPDLTC